MPKRDWINEMNDLAQAAVPAQDDRAVLEDMIIWIDKAKVGPAFVRWYRDALVKGSTNPDLVVEEHVPRNSWMIGGTK